MSSENYVGIIMAENLRFLGEGSSAQGKSGAKLEAERRRRCTYGRNSVTTETLSRGTLRNSGTRALVDPGVRERKYSSEVRDVRRREKL